jgi:dienelactone hydrolase
MFHVERIFLACLAGLHFACDAQEPVEIPSSGATLGGLYYSVTAPRSPAVVMLHGCSGMWFRPGVLTPSNADWARRLNEAGYAVLVLDSFTARGEREICSQQVRRIRPEVERAADAHAGRRWLAAREVVDSGRIHLIGWSHGGTSALHAVRSGAGIVGPDAPQFRSVVAFYPGCAVLAKKGYEADVPVLIQAGGADDWTPARHCVALAGQGASRVAIDVYPEAHHAFDRLGHRLPRFRSDVRNAASPTGRGATVGPHPAARAMALERVFRFLEETGDVPRGTG